MFEVGECFKVLHIAPRATLWIGDGQSYDGHVVVNGDTIQAVGAGPYDGELGTVNLADHALSPGLIDLLANGGFGQAPPTDGVTGLAACCGIGQ